MQATTAYTTVLGAMVLGLLAAVSEAAPNLPPSVCPNLFQYEKSPRGVQDDRWYGTITLASEFDLKGVWVKMIFDKPSIELGNWLGTVETYNGKDYLIKDPLLMLEPYRPQTVRFYIKYNPEEPPPVLTQFRLNGRTVCGEDTPADIQNQYVSRRQEQLYVSQYLGNSV